MTTARVLAVVALCLLMGLLLASPTDVANAQFGLETPERDVPLEEVTKTQMAIAAGSFIVMIIVVKFL
jgi:hypothetical protein